MPARLRVGFVGEVGYRGRQVHSVHLVGKKWPGKRMNVGDSTGVNAKPDRETRSFYRVGRRGQRLGFWTM